MGIGKAPSMGAADIDVTPVKKTYFPQVKGHIRKTYTVNIFRLTSLESIKRHVQPNMYIRENDGLHGWQNPI